MKIKLTLMLASLVLTFSGCEDNRETQRQTFPDVGARVSNTPREQVTLIQPELKFELKKVQSFSDSAAYGGYRDVYILKDNETGKEYIGISGIGISERGSHSSGKYYKQDER